MKIWVALLCLLSACASRPVEPRSDHLFQDSLFQSPSERVARDDVFAPSDAMKHYLRVEIAHALRRKGPRQALIDALNNQRGLKLEYESAMTRNAASAFDARAGNCLSLVIMTAALAKELDLTVEYNNVFTDEIWSRSEDIYFSSSHVNLTLGTVARSNGHALDEQSQRLIIDFMPHEDRLHLRSRVIGEDTIVAMYMNNRAAEAIVRGRLDDAYWWSREAIRQDARFLSAYITLGVVYRRHGQLSMAAQALQHVLEREPENVNALSNMVVVLNQAGRREEAAAVAQKLAGIEPYPPFHFFEQGLAAMKRKDFAAARDLFAKALERAAYYHEFHFGLAAAYLALGDAGKAQEQLTLAMESSTTRKDHDLYAAKLGLLTSMQRGLRRPGDGAP